MTDALLLSRLTDVTLFVVRQRVAMTLKDELGFGVVEIANPLDSNLLLGEESALKPLIKRPAQFVVAVGLAARGMADL